MKVIFYSYFLKSSTSPCNVPSPKPYKSISFSSSFLNLVTGWRPVSCKRVTLEETRLLCMTDLLPKIYGWGSKRKETLQYMTLWDFLITEGQVKWLQVNEYLGSMSSMSSISFPAHWSYSHGIALWAIVALSHWPDLGLHLL